MELEITKLFSAIIIISCLFGLMIIILKFLKNKKFLGKFNKSNIIVDDHYYINPKTALFVIKWGGKEYLILTGNNNMVIDSKDLTSPNLDKKI